MKVLSLNESSEVKCHQVAIISKRKKNPFPLFKRILPLCVSRVPSLVCTIFVLFQLFPKQKKMVFFSQILPSTECEYLPKNCQSHVCSGHSLCSAPNIQDRLQWHIQTGRGIHVHGSSWTIAEEHSVWDVLEELSGMESRVIETRPEWVPKGGISMLL